MSKYNLPNGRGFATEGECIAYKLGVLDGYDKSKRMATDLLHTSVKQMVESDLASVDSTVLGVRAADKAAAEKLAAINEAKQAEEATVGE